MRALQELPIPQQPSEASRGSAHVGCTGSREVAGGGEL